MSEKEELSGNSGLLEAEKMTNFEKIKNMTVEEMMEFILYERCCDCDCCIYVYNDNCTMPKCKDGIKAWLEQEAEE